MVYTHTHTHTLFTFRRVIEYVLLSELLNYVLLVQPMEIPSQLYFSVAFWRCE